MAGTTILTQIPIMDIFCCVAGITVSGSAFINVIGMTAQAGGICMLPRQFESCQVVVVGCGFPCCSIMAGAAGITQNTLVGVFLGVACKAVSRCTLQHLIDMAVRTRGYCVLSTQFKC